MSNSIKELLRKYNIKLTKNLGQNFLIDDNIVSKIVDCSDISKDDLVIEIGPGLGSMSRELANRAGKLIMIEIDKKLIDGLLENLKDYKNIKVINDDAMKINISKLVEEEKNDLINVKIVANLPYYITTPLIMKFLEDESFIDSMVFMVQKEVADRMSAKPGGKEYGALTIAVQYYTKPQKMFTVPPSCFVPVPNVDSAVIKLEPFKKPQVELLDEKMFFKIVKASFSQRRKTLINALCNSGFLTMDKESLKQILTKLNIDEKQRGETLSINDFANLSNCLCKL